VVFAEDFYTIIGFVAVMIDLKQLRTNPDVYRENYRRMRRPDLLEKVDSLVAFDEKLRVIQQELDQLRKSRNELSQKINMLKKAGKPVDTVLEKAATIPIEIKSKEEEYEGMLKKVQQILNVLPNLIHEDVPYGLDDSENKVVKEWGKKVTVSFPLKNHVELLEGLGLVDFDASGKSSGNGFYYLKGDLALLNQALLRYTMDVMEKKGYEYVEGPLMLYISVLRQRRNTIRQVSLYLH